MLYADYFVDHLTCTCKEFWHCFSMNKELFMKLWKSVREYDTYFMMKKVSIRVFGLSSTEKCSLL
jgi:hypothetical protein